MSMPRILLAALAAPLLLAGCQGAGADLVALPDNRIPVTGAGLLISREGRAVIEAVISAEPGWICVHADLLGHPGDLLGCAGVASGENSSIPITVDPSRLTATIHLALYRDAGTPGQQEVPDPDLPVASPLGRQVRTEQTLLGDPAWIAAPNQVLGTDQTVTIDSVYSPVPGLLVIHDGRDQHVLGYTPVRPGDNLSVPVTLELRGDVGALIAELHWDVHEPGVLNLTDPASKNVNGDYVAVPFQLLAAP